jgi:hypothetical protein
MFNYNKFFSIIFLLLCLNSVFSINSIDNLKNQLNSNINSINYKMNLTANYIFNSQANLAKKTMGELNDEIENYLVSSEFYYGIINIRSEDSGYVPLSLDNIPNVLYPAEWEKMSKALKLDFSSITQQMEDARIKIAKAQYKAALAVVLAASYQIYDISTKFSGLKGASSVLSEVGTFAVKEYLSAEYNLSDKKLFNKYITEGIMIETSGKEIEVLNNRFNILNQTKEGQNEIINTLQRSRDVILYHYEKFSQARKDTMVFEYDVLRLKKNIARLNAQILAALGIEPFVSSDSNSFDVQNFIKSLDENLVNILDGDISWENYLSLKSKIYENVEGKYNSVIYDLEKEGKDTSSVVRSYNEFQTYYNNFDKIHITKRETAIQDLIEKIGLWETATKTFLEDYSNINFLDLNYPNMININIKYDPVDKLDFNERQCVSCYFGSIESISDLSIQSNKPWYIPIISYCSELNNDVKYMNRIVNSARENKAYNLRNEIYGEIEPGFSVLYSNDHDNANVISNIKNVLSFIKTIPNYVNSKASETSKILLLIDKARITKNNIDNYVSSVGELYLPDNYCSEHQIYYNQNKVPNIFGSQISPCESELLYNYVEQEINDFLNYEINVDRDCDVVEEEIKEYLTFEEEKLDFIINLGINADELIIEMNSYNELLEKLKDIRDTYGGYLSGVYGNSYATLTYLMDNINEVNNDSSKLTKFVLIQEKITNIISKISPADMTSSSSGFNGDFAILEEDKEIILNLSKLEYLPKYGLTLNEIKLELINIKTKLNEPYENIVAQVEHISNMRGLYEQMKENRFQLEQYSTYLKSGDLWTDSTDYSVFLVATNQWKCEVLSAYANSNGFKEDVQNKLIYENILKDYLFISNTFRNKQMKRELEIVAGTPHDYVYLYPTPVDYLVPDETLSNPMLSVLYPFFSVELLTNCGMEDYLDEWEVLANEAYKEKELEEDEYWLQISIDEGIDYLYSGENRLNYLSTYGNWCEFSFEGDPDCLGRNFWLKKSKEDGIDYIHPNADGSYPIYTGIVIMILKLKLVNFMKI